MCVCVSTSACTLHRCVSVNLISEGVYPPVYLSHSIFSLNVSRLAVFFLFFFFFAKLLYVKIRQQRKISGILMSKLPQWNHTSDPRESKTVLTWQRPSSVTNSYLCIY